MIGMTAPQVHLRTDLRRRFGYPALMLTALLLVVGCGNNGTIAVKDSGNEEPVVGAIQGTVFAPEGQIAGARPFLDRFNPFNLLPRAYAALNPNVLPVGAGALVSLTEVREIDAADGRIDSPVLIEQGLTNVDGKYRILNQVADNVDVCRLMVAVGGGELLMRAFVTSTVTDIDVASETTVRVVLNRLAEAPPAQLCEFSTDDLARMQDIVANATFSATGSDVFEINRNAYNLAVDNICVRDAMQKVTDSDFDNTPSQCLRFYPELG
jgi:hypothetical protein